LSITSPPTEGQVRYGYIDNPNNATVLEGHGLQLPGEFVVPEGTYLRIPEALLLEERLGQEAARIGTFPAGVRSTLLAPGSRAPNLVLLPPDNVRMVDDEFDEFLKYGYIAEPMQVRPSSTTVTRPTFLSDILVPDMGFCTWAACRKPHP
jgi:hypothetical protein